VTKTAAPFKSLDLGGKWRTGTGLGTSEGEKGRISRFQRMLGLSSDVVLVKIGFELNNSHIGPIEGMQTLRSHFLRLRTWKMVKVFWVYRCDEDRAIIANYDIFEKGVGRKARHPCNFGRLFVEKH
jgi:hypothetical protein